jgi:hypothetical protein
MLRRLFLAAALVGVATPLAAQAPLHKDSLSIARRAAKFFYAGEVDSLVAMIAPASLSEFGGREGLLAGISQVGMRAGDETSVVEERWNMRNGQRQYWRTSKMSLFPDDFLLRFNMDAQGMITGIGMGPAAAAPPIESQGPVLPKP